MEEAEKKKYEVKVHSRIAKDYEDVLKFPGAKLFHNYWNNSIIKLATFFPKAKVLDNGCGTGLLLTDLKDKNLELYGTDISPDMTKIAKKQIKNIKIANSENLPFKNNFFDFIFCRGSIHHFYSQKKSLQEIKRTLKPNGKFILTEPFDNLLLKIPRKINQLMNKERFKEHEVLNKKQFFNLLKELNFKIEKKEYFGYIAMPILASPEVLYLFQIISKNKFLSKILITTDKILCHIPLIKKLSWHINLSCST